MSRFHLKVVLAQLACIITFSKWPAKGIPNFCWEANSKGGIDQIITLKNYLEWLDQMDLR